MVRPAPKSVPPLAALREGLAARLEGLRAEIAETKDRLELVTQGSLPKAEYVSRVHAWVDAQAKRFEAGLEYQVSALRTPDAREGPSFGLLPVRGAGAASPELVAVADGASLLCWLAGSALKDRLAKMIEASPYAEGPPLAERDRLRRELGAELDRLELAEETLICEAEQVGLSLPRRPDCRPEIVLSLEGWPKA